MRIILLAVAVLLTAAPASAKNFAFPAKNPIATIMIPDTWTTEEITYGYSAKSPDDDVFFSVEYATGARIDKMLANNTAWMTENKITSSKEPVEKAINIDGIDSKLLTVVGTDENGPTIVDFVFMPAGDNRLIMLTLWASDEERKANAADISAIESSVKAIK